jgi:hypothetical protein
MRRLLLLALLLSAPVALATDVDNWSWLTTGAPIYSVSVSTVSATASPLNGGACYRVACTVSPVYFRACVGTPCTAVSGSDSVLSTPPAERLCLRAGTTALAFVAGTSGTCSILSLAPSP